MNDLYFRYLKEREGTDHIKTDKGFVTYRIDGDVLNVFDMYILPEYRRTKGGTELCNILDNIAKEANCIKAKSGVCLRTNGCTEALMFQLKYGMKLDYSVNNYIFLSKEL